MTEMGLLAALMEPATSQEDEFNEWYDNEHLTHMQGVEGVLSATRFVAVEGWPRYLALYDLDTIATLQSDSYRGVTGGAFSPWSRRMLRDVRGWRRLSFEQRTPGRSANRCGVPRARYVPLQRRRRRCVCCLDLSRIDRCSADPRVLAGRRRAVGTADRGRQPRLAARTRPRRLGGFGGRRPRIDMGCASGPLRAERPPRGLPAPRGDRVRVSDAEAVDCVVVGGGWAGMVAARRMQQLGCGAGRSREG